MNASIRFLVAVVVWLLPTTITSAQHSGGGEANPNLITNQEALKKFRENRFGMFVHWGPVALRGEEIGWSRKRSIPADDYDALYREFNPVLFNAEEWISTAKDAGMKYFVLVAKHHDGFSLWDSQYSEYDMANTPYGMGVVKSLADECKKQGLDFGFYYSILDWWHPDYPLTRTETTYQSERPGTVDPAYVARMERYQQYIKNQLKELIDMVDPSMIWFDGEWEWPWTHEMGMDLYAYLRALKDELLINNRVDKGRAGMSGITKSSIYAGDYATPEQEVGAFDNVNAWETCMTIAKQWAWKPNDEMKSKQGCIHTLLQTVGGDGNLLFNVGPMPDGRIEQRQIDRLKEMGEWLQINGQAVYGTRGGPFKPTDYMVSTRKENNIYLHLLKHPGTDFSLPFYKGIKVNQVRFLTNEQTLAFVQHKESIDIILPDSMPDQVASVIVLELSRPSIDLEVIQRLRY